MRHASGLAWAGRGLPERFKGTGQTHPNGGQCLPVGWIPGLNKKGECEPRNSILLFPGGGSKMTSCLTLLPPPTRRDCALELRTSSRPSLSHLYQVVYHSTEKSD